MATIDALKNRLIDQILMTKNEKLLKAVSEILQSTHSESKIELTSFQKEMIQMGLKDIEEGNLVSESDLEKLDEEWMD
jgi:predicted transcriptional regulator